MQKSMYLKAVLLYISIAGLTVVGFQNCAPTQFQKIEDLSSNALVASPFCSPSEEPKSSENLFCPSPNQLNQSALQRYRVVCSDGGVWSRQELGAIDYSLCPKVCPLAERPSDVENVMCPESNENLGVQRYNVDCSFDGKWSRTVTGTADYSLCEKACDPLSKPPIEAAINCPDPNANLASGTQRYTVTCERNGTWSSSELDKTYDRCPVCSSADRPLDSANVKCPSSNDLNAVQNYLVSCGPNGVWNKTPSSLDIAACPAPTCDPGTKPALSETVACPAPSTTSNLSVQNYNVSCSGINWVRTAGLRDDSACPKLCTGVAPADDFDSLPCQSPFEVDKRAKKKYTYVCNSTSGNYDRTDSGSAIDYSLCPRSCSGTNPAVPQEIACPVGQIGTAYQNYSSTCDTSTGQWSTPVATTKDNSSCSADLCLLPKPSDFDLVACDAPFAGYKDAKRMYAPATCTSTGWVRGAATGVIDKTSCPINDCSGTINPGPEKIIGLCPGGATGNVFQMCSVSCSGITYNQVSCSANNYSRCDCGANATFNVVTRTCDSTYTYTPASIVYGSCSATACGTSGIKAVSSFTCQRSDGVTVANSFCTAPTSQSCSAAACATCSSGTSTLVSAANNAGTTNTCSFAWNSAQEGQSAVITQASNSGAMTRSCSSTGTWINITSSCPAPANINYTYSAASIVYGSCSATVCGTSGTKAVSSYTCQRSDGVTVANSFCTAPTSQSCSAAACPTCSNYNMQKYTNLNQSAYPASGLRAVLLTTYEGDKIANLPVKVNVPAGTEKIILWLNSYHAVPWEISDPNLRIQQIKYSGYDAGTTIKVNNSSVITNADSAALSGRFYNYISTASAGVLNGDSEPFYIDSNFVYPAGSRMSNFKIDQFVDLAKSETQSIPAAIVMGLYSTCKGQQFNIPDF